jgi:hypothetical protein
MGRQLPRAQGTFTCVHLAGGQSVSRPGGARSVRPARSSGGPNTVPAARLATPAQERELARVRAKFELTEKEWQAQVVQLARLYGWRVFHPLHSRGSEPGWPDLVLVRPPVMIITELKTDGGRLRPAQREWLADLERVSEANSTVHVGVWRPADFDQVHGILRREGA